MKKKKGGGEGGANWMDTYGDMVTLLLCFFVLLYSMSTISEENWKALVMSFNPLADTTLHATPGGDGPNADADESGAPIEQMPTQEQVDQDIEDLYQALKDYVSQEGKQSSITITKEGGQVFVSFNEAVFFEPEDYALVEESKPILETVGSMLSGVKDSIEEIRVQGHTAQGTPGVPNNPETDRFLASNRATEVVVYLQTHSEVDPARLIPESFGQWRPKADNNTYEGRSENRRVEMIISGRDIEKELEDGIQRYTTT